MEDDKKHPLTDEEIDYLTEMMNIGAGNAGAVLSQLLQVSVDMRTPKLHVIKNMEDTEGLFQEKSPELACVTMQMVGDIKGSIKFIVTNKEREKLLLMARKAMAGMEDVLRDRDYNISVLAETGNILAGVYLSAINEFCRLSIFHTVPSHRFITADDLFREIFGQNSNNRVLLIKNEFVINKEQVTTYLLLVISPGYEKKLLESIKAARRVYGDTGEK